MSEPSEKTRKVRAKGWTEAEGREALQEWQESGLSAGEVCRAARGFGCAAFVLGGALEQQSAVDVNFVSVPLSSQHAVELEHRGATVRLGSSA